MNAKKERAGPARKKKLDDAPLSSEDEDQKAFEVKKKSKSPKIGHPGLKITKSIKSRYRT